MGGLWKDIWDNKLIVANKKYSLKAKISHKQLSSSSFLLFLSYPSFLLFLSYPSLLLFLLFWTSQPSLISYFQHIFPSSLSSLPSILNFSTLPHLLFSTFLYSLSSIPNSQPYLISHFQHFIPPSLSSLPSILNFSTLPYLLFPTCYSSLPLLPPFYSQHILLSFVFTNFFIQLNKLIYAFCSQISINYIFHVLNTNFLFSHYSIFIDIKSDIYMFINICLNYLIQYPHIHHL